MVARLNRRTPSRRAQITDGGHRDLGPALRLHRFTLGNGLEIRLLPERSAPVISYHTWFRVGSRQEQPGKTGLSHLLEHLMFNETRNLPHGEFDRTVEAVGGDSNASTWTDWTQYHLELPASELGLAVRLESDRMANLVLRKPAVESEKEVVANERRMRVEDDLEGEVSEQMYSMAFRKHPYHWPTIGWMKDIEAFTAADCRAFYRRYYAPNNAIVVIVGDIKLERTLRLLQDRYGGLKSEKVPPYETVLEPRQRAERRRTLERATPTPKLALGYPAPAFGDPDHQVVHLISELLFGGRGSRMFKLLVDDKQMVSELHGSAAPFQDPGLFEIWLSLRHGCSVEQLEPLVEAQLARLVSEDVSKDELERAKNRLELDALQGLQTAAGIADQVGFLETVVGDSSDLLVRIARYRNVTPADVRRVAASLFDPRRRTRIEIKPSAPEAHPDGNGDGAGAPAGAAS